MTPEDHFLPDGTPGISRYNSCHSYDLGFVHFVCINSNQDYAMFDEYKAFCKAIWESESIYKEEFFEGWSEEDIESLYIDQAATELRQQLTAGKKVPQPVEPTPADPTKRSPEEEKILEKELISVPSTFSL